MYLGYLSGCKYHYGNRFGPFDEPKEEIIRPRYFYPPMYYRFHRFIPRRRLWGVL